MTDLGRELAEAVRTAAAALLLTGVRENLPQLRDPLALFEGALDLATSEELVREACVSVVYVLHRALSRAGMPEPQVIALIQETARHALRGRALPVSDMSRYFATDMPAAELHRILCKLLGIDGTDAAELALTEAFERLARDTLTWASFLRGQQRRPALG